MVEVDPDGVNAGVNGVCALGVTLERGGVGAPMDNEEKRFEGVKVVDAVVSNEVTSCPPFSMYNCYLANTCMNYSFPVVLYKAVGP